MNNTFDRAANIFLELRATRHKVTPPLSDETLAILVLAGAVLELASASQTPAPAAPPPGKQLD